MRFSQALPRAIELLQSRSDLFRGEVTLVRDLYGRIRIALPKKFEASAGTFAKNFDDALGGFGPGKQHLFMFKEEMLAPEVLFESPDRLLISETSELSVYLLDRQVMGHDWTRAPLGESGARHPQRVAFFGLKGGVGRSTALAVLAWRLSRQGKRVLVMDLDLESPGVGSLLLPHERLPDFGVVDWFVEEAIGQADDALAGDMVAQSPLVGDAELGEIIVAPTAGRGELDYLAKLARAYVEVRSPGRALHFADRLHGMIQKLEQKYLPDVVLLDSRAGMHDIAAVTVTRLDALAFLFAVDGAYTWNAYRLLFQHWHQNRALLSRFRENLRMVAGLVPDTERATYFYTFRSSAYQLFLDYIYDPVTGDEEGEDPFSFDLNTENAPHDMLHVNWNRAFFAFDPVNHPEAVDDGLLQGGFGDFVQRAGEIILGGPLKWA